MPDPTTEALARKLASRRGVTGKTNNNDRQQAADILAEFLVVPHSDIVGTEYAHRHVLDNSGECVHRAASAADARGMAGYDGDAVQRPILGWSVIPENSPRTPCSDCGYPEGRQADCGTCKGQPLPENGQKQ